MSKRSESWLVNKSGSLTKIRIVAFQ